MKKSQWTCNNSNWVAFLFITIYNFSEVYFKCNYSYGGGMCYLMAFSWFVLTRDWTSSWSIVINQWHYDSWFEGIPLLSVGFGISCFRFIVNCSSLHHMEVGLQLLVGMCKYSFCYFNVSSNFCFLIYLTLGFCISIFSAWLACLQPLKTALHPNSQCSFLQLCRKVTVTCFELSGIMTILFSSSGLYDVPFFVLSAMDNLWFSFDSDWFSLAEDKIFPLLI